MIQQEIIARGEANAQKSSISPLQEDNKINLGISKRNTGMHGDSRFYYSVGDYNILLEEGIKAENLTQSEIYKLPYPPFWCLGIINIRGNILPIVNLHALLQTGKKPENKSKLLLLEHEDLSPIVFQIDKLPFMIDYNNYKKGIIPENSPTWLKGSLTNHSTTIYEISHKKLLSQLKQLQN